MEEGLVYKDRQQWRRCRLMRALCHWSNLGNIHTHTQEPWFLKLEWKENVLTHDALRMLWECLKRRGLEFFLKMLQVWSSVTPQALANSYNWKPKDRRIPPCGWPTQSGQPVSFAPKLQYYPSEWQCRDPHAVSSLPNHSQKESQLRADIQQKSTHKSVVFSKPPRNDIWKLHQVSW